MDAKSFLLQKNEPFDLAFLDPPYQTGLLQEVLPKVAAIMRKGGVILCEHPADEAMPDATGEFVRDRQYRYGKIMVTVYRHKEVMDG